MATYTGYGNQVTLSEETQDRSFLTGIGQTTVPGTSIIGRTANEAYDKYKESGATKEQLATFARQVRGQF